MPGTKKSPKATKTSVRIPAAYDPAVGKKALEALRPTLDAVPKDRIANMRVDVEAATYAALGVAGFLAAPDVQRRFARLPAEELDLGAVTGLAPACFATLYTMAEARAAGALQTEALVPAAVAGEAAEVEARMQRLCEYHLSDDPEVRPELDRLRPGIGLRDLANDLLGYARLYELRAGVVKADTKNYRSEDAPRARELAGTIIRAISDASTPKSRAAFELHARAWTVLRDRYDEARSAGLWLFRKDPERDDRFPSLFAAGRAGRPRKQSPTAGADDAARTDETATPPALATGGAESGVVNE